MLIIIIIITTAMAAMLMTTAIILIVDEAPAGSGDARLPQCGLLLITLSDTGRVSMCIGHYRGF
jgi:hypothetical protein